MTTYCEYVVTYADFFESMKLYRRISRPALIGYLIEVWILPVICLVGLIMIILSFVHASREPQLLDYIYMGLLLGAALGLPSRYRVGLQRAFKQRDRLTQGRAMRFEFDGEFTRFLVPGGTEISYPWSAFTHFSESPSVAVLSIGDAAFHTIPKRALTTDDLTRLQTLAVAATKEG